MRTHMVKYIAIRVVPRSPCRHQLFIHRTRKKKFWSRIFLRLGEVTLTAKDRVSIDRSSHSQNKIARLPFILHFLHLYAMHTFPRIIHQNILLFQKQNATVVFLRRAIRDA